MDLFDSALGARIEKEAPLAHRMRPRTLDEFVGQEHIIGPGRLLRRAIQADQLSSLIFCGPPGTGKTTLASVIAQKTQSHFLTINAVLAGVKELREAIDAALERRKLHGTRTTLFVDEVHRWNKAQQDALLPHVENGTIILIGATTENPYFEVNKALVSRSRIFQLRPLTPDHLRRIARHALEDPERGFGRRRVEVAPEALDHLVDVASGDARGVLNALELAVETTTPDARGVVKVDRAVAEDSIQRRAVLYDKDGDVHFDTISAFIKSLRGSDPDAALYWMARMVYAGEDPRFIFRRMAILAGEDVGLADPGAAAVVAACWEIYERVGMPEGRFHLAQAALYLATCPKSSSTMAFFDALAAVENESGGDVPVHLKDASRDAQGFGHGAGYLYPHAYKDHWVAQQYLPASLEGRLFYRPSDQGHERALGDQVERRREAQLAAMLDAAGAPPVEVLTSGPADRKRDAWLERTIASSSLSLETVRDRLFERARIERHHVVCVLEETTGMLTWEALRRAPEGGVWVSMTDHAVADVIEERSRRLPHLERPHVIEAALADLPAHLASPDRVRFDRILAHNAFTRRGDAGAIAPLVRSHLLPGGQVLLAQAVPRHGQRLAPLVTFPRGEETIRARIIAAEEALHSSPGDRIASDQARSGTTEGNGTCGEPGTGDHPAADPITGWDVPDLVASLSSMGLGVESCLETIETSRPLTPKRLEAWLAAGVRADGRPSYGALLAAHGLSPDDLARLRALVLEQLAGRTVRWRTAIVFLTASTGRPGEVPIQVRKLHR